MASGPLIRPVTRPPETSGAEFSRQGQIVAVESEVVALVGLQINCLALRYETAGRVVDIRLCADRPPPSSGGLKTLKLSLSPGMKPMEAAPGLAQNMTNLMT